jgi:hypothetical protein
MDEDGFRRLAARSLRLATIAKNPDDAVRLRMMAADYLEMAERRPAQQQPPIDSDKNDDPS